MSNFKLKYEARGALVDKDLTSELLSLNDRTLIESVIVQGGGEASKSYDIPKKEVLVFLDPTDTRQDAVGLAVGYQDGFVVVEPKVSVGRNNSHLLELITNVDPPKYRVSPILDHNDAIDSFVIKPI